MQGVRGLRGDAVLNEQIINIINMINRDQLVDFFEVISLVKPQGINDMGLIVCDSKDRKNLSKMFSDKIKIVDFDESTNDDQLLEDVARGFKSKSWLVIDYASKPLSSKVYSALRRLSTANMLQLFNFAGQDEINLKQPEESSIVFLTTWNDIHNSGVSNFTNLFGPVLNLASSPAYDYGVAKKGEVK